MRQMEMAEKLREEERDHCLNRARPMIPHEQTWREKCLAREENGTDSDNNNEGLDESKEKEGEEGNDGQHIDVVMEVNMVFVLPKDFRAPESDVSELAFGAEKAMFEKPMKPGKHMRPLYIKGHLDGVPVNWMMIDSGASVNIMPVSLLKELGHNESDLKRTNMCPSGFSGEPVEAKGIVSKELTIGSKTMPTTIFVVNLKGCYNMLLGHDWIHANGCIPSMMHQCMAQWVGDKVEIIRADDTACVALAKSQVDIQGGKMECLIRWGV
jgi:hypothetical protein